MTQTTGDRLRGDRAIDADGITGLAFRLARQAGDSPCSEIVAPPSGLRFHGLIHHFERRSCKHISSLNEEVRKEGQVPRVDTSDRLDDCQQLIGRLGVSQQQVGGASLAVRSEALCGTLRTTDQGVRIVGSSRHGVMRRCDQSGDAERRACPSSRSAQIEQGLCLGEALSPNHVPRTDQSPHRLVFGCKPAAGISLFE